MKHPFYCKKIADLRPDTVNAFINLVTKLNYVSNNDFPDNVIQVSSAIPTAIYNMIKRDLSSLVSEDSVMNANISRMAPVTYLAEHSDLSTFIGDSSRHDNTVKLQIPIITNDQVFMMWRKSYHETFIKHFKPGEVYIIDNVTKHAVINGGTDYRYYLTVRFHSKFLFNADILESLA
jgi:hypothetical protein